MATVNLFPLETIPLKIKNVTFGYIRNHSKSANIPIDIINIVLLYYYNRGQFNQDKHGSNLKFIDYKTVQKTEDDSDFSTVIFGPTFETESTFNIVAIHLKLIKASRMFCVGFLTTATINEAIRNWNHQIGWGDNKAHSINLYSYKSGATYLRDKLKAFKKLGEIGKFEDGTVFVLQFNFKEKYVRLSQKDTDDLGRYVTHSFKEYDYITPAMSLMGEQVIEIVKYEDVACN